MLTYHFKSTVRFLSGGRCDAVGGIHPDRRINQWVLLFVRKRCLKMTVGDTGYEVHPDQVLMLPAEVQHRGTAPYPEGLSFYWVHFHVDESEIDSVHEAPLFATLTRPHIMVELIRRLLDDQQSGRLQTDHFKGTLHLLQILTEIAGNHLDTSSLPGATLTLATRANQIIRSRYRLVLSTSSIAAELACHPDHLGRVYHQVFGQPLTEALNRFRIDQAALQLIESNAGIDEIGYRVGFGDKGYFRRLFKRYRNTTPSAFRRLHAGVYLNS